MNSVFENIVPGYLKSESTSECSVLISESCYDWLILPVMGIVFLLCCLAVYLACEFCRKRKPQSEDKKKLVWEEDLEYGSCECETKTDDDCFESAN